MVREIPFKLEIIGDNKPFSIGSRKASKTSSSERRR
jgi:hypothetical protein